MHPALAQQGAWQTPIAISLGNQPVTAVHMMHVYNGVEGKVLIIPTQTAAAQNCPGGMDLASDFATLWTPPAATAIPGSPGTFVSVPHCRTYMFCEGHCALADGRVLTARVSARVLSGIQGLRTRAFAAAAPSRLRKSVSGERTSGRSTASQTARTAQPSPAGAVRTR